MKRHACMLAASVVFVSVPAGAWIIECRFVERIGDVDVVLPDNTITVRPRSTHRYRIQFRVVPQANDAQGGFIGWNRGTVVASGGVNTRTGRKPNPLPRETILPFIFAPKPPGEGLPSTDPFLMLTDVDCRVGTASPIWVCNSDGTWAADQGAGRVHLHLRDYRHCARINVHNRDRRLWNRGAGMGHYRLHSA